MTFGHAMPQVLGTYSPTPKQQRKQSTRGYDPARRPKARTLLTDHEVLEARWMHHYGSWSAKKVASHYGLEYGYAYNLLVYATRSKLSPDLGDFPQGHQPTPRSPS